MRTETDLVETLRGLVSSPSRIALVLATAVAGAAMAFFLAIGYPTDARTFAAIAPLTLLVISVLTPFSTAALTHDLRDRVRDGSESAALPSRWLAAVVYGLAFGVYGALIAALAVTVTGSTAADPWAGAGGTLLGCLVVQLIPVALGTGAGLLVRNLNTARLLTVVLPLGVSFVVARVAPPGTTDWMTPLGAAAHLLPGPMSLLHWAQWIITAALWAVLPNVIGARLLARRVSR